MLWTERWPRFKAQGPLDVSASRILQCDTDPILQHVTVIPNMCNMCLLGGPCNCTSFFKSVIAKDTRPRTNNASTTCQQLSSIRAAPNFSVFNANHLTSHKQICLTMPKITADSEPAEEMLGEVVATTSQIVSRSTTRLASGGTLTDMWTKKPSTTTKTKVTKLVLSMDIVDST